MHTCVRDNVSMFYCPRCKAAVPADALYCARCGYNQTNARMAALPKSLPDKDSGSLSPNMHTPPPHAVSLTQTPAQTPAQTPVPPVQQRAFRLSLPSTPRSLPPSVSQSGISGQSLKGSQQFMPRPVVRTLPQSLPNTPANGTAQSVYQTPTIDRQQPGTMHISFYWLTVALMTCVILGLGVFIFSTYQTSTAASSSYSGYTPDFAPPRLSAQNWQGLAIQHGSTLHLHGDNFDVGDPIIFLIDGSTSISGSNGRQIAIEASNQGSFDVAVPVPASWSAGPHIIEAEDNKTGQTAYLTIQVS